jgi:hypothetical protein
MSRHARLWDACRPLQLVAVWVASLAAAAAYASGNTCGKNQIKNDKLVVSNYQGVDPSGQQPPWNPDGVTVYDYRKCQQADDPGDYLDGQIVADSLGAIVPHFQPTVAGGGEYRVYAPDPGHQSGKLLLYLSGQPDLNTGKEQLLQRAAYHGYHVVATRYWNDTDATSKKCGEGPDDSGSFGPHSSPVPENPYTDSTGITFDECIIRLHRNQFENWSVDFTSAHIGPVGAFCDPNPLDFDFDICNGTTVGNELNDGDASKYRIRKLLKYLDQRHPQDGWGQFSKHHNGHYDRAPYFDWSKITVMGHSSGSKVFFHLQHDQASIDRVILLSGPNLDVQRSGIFPPFNLSSYVTTRGATALHRIYAFSNTHDPKFPRALNSWRFMTGEQGSVGLDGASVAGGWESERDCSSCSACQERKPVAPSSGSPIRAIQYSGNAQFCVGKASADDPIDGSWAHESTTENSSCAGSTPDTCWYLAIWDYLLTNP